MAMIESKSSRVQGKETGKERTRMCGAVRCGAVRCGALHTHTRARTHAPLGYQMQSSREGERKRLCVCGAHTHTNARSLT